MKKVAIIGAGLSGLTLADQIADIAEVTLFEKFNQVSGRMATRKYEAYAFDHGAQFFTVKHPDFLAYINTLQAHGVVARWDARFVEVDGTYVKKSRAWEQSYPHYVGVPDMASVGQYLALKLLQRNVELHLNTEVKAIHKRDNQWCLTDSHNNPLGSYDWVVTAIPAKQATTVLPNDFMHMQTLHGSQMLPCYALMLGFEQALNLTWDAAHITNAILSWVSVNSSKPERANGTCLVAMSRNQWAADHFNQPESWVIDALLHALSGIVGEQVLQAKVLQLKKWHYANAQKTGLKEVLIDAKQQLASCGDWCISGRVESAFVSALQLSKSLRAVL